jgi:hypothetical protein
MQKDPDNHIVIIRQIKSTEEFQELELDRRILLQQSNIRSAFLTWEWLFVRINENQNSFLSDNFISAASEL